MLKAVGEAFSVVGAGAKLWLKHWPVLLTIALLALAGRMGAQWAALRLSDIYNTLGWLALVFGPLSAVTGIVLMLYTLRHSMPALTRAADTTAPEDPLRHRERRLIDMLASVLVPFLAVYASYGFLKEDLFRFYNSLYGEEYAQADFFSGELSDGSRFEIGTGWVLPVVIVSAVVLKFGLAKLEGRKSGWGLGLLGAYVEALWLAAIATYLTIYKDIAWDWVESRRGVEMFVDGWEAMLSKLGPFADVVDAVGSFAINVAANVDSLIIVPIAWLTVGAVVYGHKLVEPSPPPQPRLLRMVPGPVRRAGLELSSEVTERFHGLFGGLRQLAVAGLAPMLMFVVAFLASKRLEDGLNELARWIIGPQSASQYLAFTPHITIFTRAIGLTVTMCLLAAAVERVLATGGAVRDDEEETERTRQPA
ncbi:hypothetical protein [Kineosporia babensis]|uniref:Uncharacterized protein n=1 Tax=Kineosporia babensis TaxID=499548 RepID=A0A9X1SZ72_9ACTN|nr:hypothetical protein [Kineosporia babensis]MCD5311698.1 hypothetical protein [Kineosporia babensis]